jgi:hypothetical protein
MPAAVDFTADLDTVLADVGVPVSSPSVALSAGVLGWLRAETLYEMRDGAAVEVTHQVLALKPGTLGAFAADALLSIDGVAFRARSPLAGKSPFQRWVVTEEIS